jgi:hypothetical protein
VDLSWRRSARLRTGQAGHQQANKDSAGGKPAETCRTALEEEDHLKNANTLKVVFLEPAQVVTGYFFDTTKV